MLARDASQGSTHEGEMASTPASAQAGLGEGEEQRHVAPDAVPLLSSLRGRIAHGSSPRKAGAGAPTLVSSPGRAQASGLWATRPHQTHTSEQGAR